MPRPRAPPPADDDPSSDGSDASQNSDSGSDSGGSAPAATRSGPAHPAQKMAREFVEADARFEAELHTWGVVWGPWTVSNVPVPTTAGRGGVAANWFERRNTHLPATHLKPLPGIYEAAVVKYGAREPRQSGRKPKAAAGAATEAQLNPADAPAVPGTVRASDVLGVGYVGMSSNLRQRIYSGHAYKGSSGTELMRPFLEAGCAVAFRWAYLPDKEACAAAETALLQAHDYAFNTSANGSTRPLMYYDAAAEDEDARTLPLLDYVWDGHIARDAVGAEVVGLVRRLESLKLSPLERNYMRHAMLA